MNYINKKPTIFFVTAAILFFMSFSFVFLVFNINYFVRGHKVIVNQENNLLLIEASRNLGGSWNKVFSSLDRHLIDRDATSFRDQEYVYLDESRRSLDLLRDYYANSNTSLSDNIDLSGIFLNISRNVNRLEILLPHFYELAEQGRWDEARDLRQDEIAQLENRLDNYVGLFIDNIRRQNLESDSVVLVQQQQSSRIFIYLFLFYFLLFIALPVYAFKVLLVYIGNFSRVIHKIMVGDMSERMPAQAVPAEFAELSLVFNKMAERLQGIYNSMELKVKAKTSELDRQLLASKEQTLSLEQQKDDLEKTKSSILNILEDIDEEKNKSQSLAQDLEKYRLAVDNASDYIVITDANGVILYGNKGLEKITGYKVNDCLGHKVGTKELWGGNMPTEFYAELWDTVKKKKKSFAAEFNDRRRNGEPFVAAVTISPILNKSKEVEFFVAIGRDITVAKQIDRSKSEFVSLASHQLRTPLTSIKWQAEMMFDQEIAGKLNKKQTEIMNGVYESNQRMIELVDSLLNVSRLDLGTLELVGDPSNLSLVVKDVVSDMQSMIVLKKTKLTVSLDPKLPLLQLDKKMSYLIIQNLLTNSVKYSPSSSPVKLSIKTDGPDKVLISVVDKGYGIPAADREKIFDKLFRASNAHRFSAEGNGLGLYLVKEVVTRIGGQVWFESHEGKGTSFFVSLPVDFKTLTKPKK